MNTSPQHPVHIRNQINQLELERDRLALPDLVQLEQQIQFHSARTNSVDPQTANHHRDALQTALAAKDQATVNHARRDELNRQIATLTGQLELLMQEEKNHMVESANRKMQDAHNEFYLAATQCVRAYRRCMNVGRANQGIPGSATKLPPPFDFQHMRSAYGSQAFTVAQQMAFGPLRIEQDDDDNEQREAA